jgi:hypothetical protein
MDFCVLGSNRKVKEKLRERRREEERGECLCHPNEENCKN